MSGKNDSIIRRQPLITETGARDDLYRDVVKSIDTKSQTVEEIPEGNPQLIKILRNKIEIASLRFDDNGKVIVKGFFGKKSMDNLSDIREYLARKGVKLKGDKELSKASGAIGKNTG